jgi:hypothetical protein
VCDDTEAVQAASQYKPPPLSSPAFPSCPALTVATPFAAQEYVLFRDSDILATINN